MPSEFQRRGQEARLQGLPREYTNDGDEGGNVAMAKAEWLQGWDEIDDALTDNAYRLQAEHNAIWQPILAAHRVAAALRTIADATPTLSVDAMEAYVPGLSNLPVGQWQQHLRRQADAIEIAAPLPITPTEEDMQALFEMYIDCLGDLSSKDRAWEQMDQMTEADKAEAIAQMLLEGAYSG